ncbi:hypothetical protein BDF22DRAFT_294413 [Syncephalis plumigaleata]|nr:hypothetical protein BDF22DRAFT_294413 [Syncephalis plumigaleata]
MRLYTFISIALLFISLYQVAESAPPSTATSNHTGSKAESNTTSSSSSRAAVTGVVCGGAAGAVIVVGALVYRYRRNKKQQQPIRTSTVAGRTSAGRGAMRGTLRPSRSSSIMLRHAVQNNSNHQSTFGSPIPTMKRGGRRKGAPTAIMVEVPPASVSLGVPVATPSGTGAGQRVAAQRSIGLHVPPSPAYDFRGRGNEMPVTPRTPCMTMPTSGNSVADRMV